MITGLGAKAFIDGLGFVWKYKTLIGLAATLGLLGYYGWLAKSRGQERDEAVAQVESLKGTVDAMREWHSATTDALERKVDSERERSDFEARAARANQADRVAGDGPLAPVLHNGLQRLHERQAARRNQNTR